MICWKSFYRFSIAVSATYIAVSLTVGNETEREHTPEQKFNTYMETLSAAQTALPASSPTRRAGWRR